jgi:hypothetical protein
MMGTYLHIIKERGMMRNLKKELEEDGEFCSGVYVYPYEDGSVELGGCFEVEDLQAILEFMQSKRTNNNQEEE